MRKAIGAAIIKDGCILLERKQKTWTLPRVKPEIGESDIQCLFREIRKELPQLILRDIKYLGVFIGITSRKSDRRCAEVYYLVEVDGKITPGVEIKTAKWIKNPEEYNLSDIAQEIVLFLRQEGQL